jgi:energy-coupling factor transporter ATP-binding protein EcfA2
VALSEKTQTSLRIRDLTFTYGGRSQPTLNGLNLDLYPGEITLIAGETGSGKSTLLNALTGIIPHHIGGQLTGEIECDGVSILPQTIRERTRFIGTLLQNVETQIFTDRVSEEVAFGLENLNLAPNQITAQTDAMLAEFGLTTQHNWAIAALSAGQKQRLVLSCILAMGQPILLLDEPFAYLDRDTATLLLQLLCQRANQGQSILLIEHRLNLVERVCDRIYQLEQGDLHLKSDVEVQSRRDNSSLIQEASSRQKPSFQPVTITLRTQALCWSTYPAFPDVQAIAGETLLLSGDNGCGKTTFLKLICGLLKPSRGRIEILGRDTRDRTVVELAKTVGFVLQNPNHQLFAETVRQEVLPPGMQQSAQEILERLQLDHCAEQHPQSLSQGQKRRLALGAVLARNPRICLLDEITVGQDERSLSLMLVLLRDFTQNGGTLLLTSHDPVAAEVLNARVVKLRGAIAPI